MPEDSLEKPYSAFVFDKYCTLRNFLRKADLFQSLQAIWAHCNLQQIANFQLPSYIVGEPSGYRSARTRDAFIKFHVLPWELEIIAKELIINAPLIGGKKNLAHWKHFSTAINKLKHLEDDIAGQFTSEENVLSELKRISHRQFPWQTRPDTDKAIRYWKIYSELGSNIEDVYGVPFAHYYTVALVLFAIYIKNFALNYPPKIELGSINIATLEKLLRFLALDYEVANELLKTELSMYHDYAYAYHSLRARPLIKITHRGRDYLVCPLPTFLFNRVTDGIYYDLISSANPSAEEAKNKIGESFQAYIGEYLTVCTQTAAMVIPESGYGGTRHRKDTIDWLLVDKNTDGLFIECKAKRMTYGAKTELENDGAVDSDLSKLADAVVQAYLSILDYKNGLYPHTHPVTRKQFVAIVTLEEWYLFGDHLKPKLDAYIKEKLAIVSIDEKVTEEIPFFIFSASSMEKLAHILSVETLESIFAEAASDPQKKYWHVDNYILDKYQQLLSQTNNPFSNEYDVFIEQTLASLNNQN